MCIIFKGETKTKPYRMLTAQSLPFRDERDIIILDSPQLTSDFFLLFPLSSCNAIQRAVLQKWKERRSQVSILNPRWVLYL